MHMYMYMYMYVNTLVQNAIAHAYDVHTRKLENTDTIQCTVHIHMCVHAATSWGQVRVPVQYQSILYMYLNFLCTSLS